MARVAFTAGLAIAGTTATQAAVWNHSAQASTHAGYDDNPRLIVGDVTATEYLAIEAATHSAYETESLSWSVDPRIVWSQYRNHMELNRTEAYAGLSLEKTSETAEYVINYNWTRDTTLTSERGLTGLEEVNRPHTSNALTFNVQQTLTERLDAQGMLYAATHRYSDASKVGLVNYNYGVAQLDIGYAPAINSRVSLDAAVGKLKVPDQDRFDKTNQSLTLTYSKSFAERWQCRASAGPSQIRTRFSTESGTVYSLDITRKAERSTMQLKLVRDIAPTGQGVLTRRKQLTLSASHEWSARWNANINLTTVRNDSVLLAYDLDFSGVRYSDVNLSVSWRWTPTVSISLVGGYADQRLQNADRSALHRYASLSLNWNGMTHTLH